MFFRIHFSSLFSGKWNEAIEFEIACHLAILGSLKFRIKELIIFNRQRRRYLNAKARSALVFFCLQSSPQFNATLNLFSSFFHVLPLQTIFIFIFLLFSKAATLCQKKLVKLGCIQKPASKFQGSNDGELTNPDEGHSFELKLKFISAQTLKPRQRLCYKVNALPEHNKFAFTTLISRSYFRGR